MRIEILAMEKILKGFNNHNRRCNRWLKQSIRLLNPIGVQYQSLTLLHSVSPNVIDGKAFQTFNTNYNLWN